MWLLKLGWILKWLPPGGQAAVLQKWIYKTEEFLNSPATSSGIASLLRVFYPAISMRLFLCNKTQRVERARRHPRALCIRKASEAAAPEGSAETPGLLQIVSIWAYMSMMLFLSLFLITSWKVLEIQLRRVEDSQKQRFRNLRNKESWT